MDKFNSDDLPNTLDESLPQKEGKKRTSYVAKDHRSMIEFVSAIYRNLGHTDYHSNKAIAAVYGLSPDSIKQHLTSSQQYRLLELKFGVGYKITDLFKRIFLPVNDEEKRAAIIESLKSPETYTQLFKEYEFHILPPTSGIKNHFVRNWHLREDIAEKTAQIFIENLKEYELLDARGVLLSGMKITSTNIVDQDKPKQVDSGIEAVKIDLSNEIINNSETVMIDIVIPLKTSKFKAHLLIPEDYQPEDLDRISKFVDALK